MNQLPLPIRDRLRESTKAKLRHLRVLFRSLEFAPLYAARVREGEVRCYHCGERMRKRLDTNKVAA